MRKVHAKNHQNETPSDVADRKPSRPDLPPDGHDQAVYDRLLRRMQQGDRAAFQSLYEAAARAVYAYALSILQNRDDAEEAMQDTFLTVWTQCGSYVPSGKRVLDGSTHTGAFALNAAAGGAPYDMAYNPDSEVSGFNVISKEDESRGEPFAKDLCIVVSDQLGEEVDMSKAEAAVLCDLNSCRVLYSKNAHERLSPASLTKIMTALVALKYGSMEQMLTATDAVKITESGAQLAGIKAGDRMTLDQALHLLLMYSANDVAMMVAENVGGSVDEFVEMMNREATALGATNTHFVNPHGLTAEDHYTTAYDLYLMFNAAIQYEKFDEIIHMTSYDTTYYDGAGNAVPFSTRNTNLFLQETYKAPESVTVIGGKTGTTKAAGSCLILLSRDSGGSPYISVILKAESRDVVYESMIDLLEEIRK